MSLMPSGTKTSKTLKDKFSQTKALHWLKSQVFGPKIKLIKPNPTGHNDKDLLQM